MTRTRRAPPKISPRTRKRRTRLEAAINATLLKLTSARLMVLRVYGYMFISKLLGRVNIYSNNNHYSHARYPGGLGQGRGNRRDRFSDESSVNQADQVVVSSLAMTCRLGIRRGDPEISVEDTLECAGSISPSRFNVQLYVFIGCGIVFLRVSVY